MDNFNMVSTVQLNNAAVQLVAQEYGLETAKVWAVADVESGGRGYDSVHRLLMRYEGHIFSKETGHVYDGSHPGCSWSHWDVNKPSGWAPFMDAQKLDETAALRSASYGMFQLMGFNHKLCGLGTVKEFVSAHLQGEPDQLRIAMAFIKGAGLLDELQRGDWAGFAYGYNGSGYASNRYDEKLAQAYIRRASADGETGLSHQGGAPRPVLVRGMFGEDVLDMQRALNRSGTVALLLSEDGVFGLGTEEAVKDFQKVHGLTMDGKAGPATFAALKPWMRK